MSEQGHGPGPPELHNHLRGLAHMWMSTSSRPGFPNEFSWRAKLCKACQANGQNVRGKTRTPKNILIYCASNMKNTALQQVAFSWSTLHFFQAGHVLLLFGQCWNFPTQCP